MKPSWIPFVSNVVELAGPYLILGGAWWRWLHDPYRASLPRWRDLLVLLSLLLATAGAVLFALFVTGHLFPRPLPGSFSRWPLTYANGMLYALLAGLGLSLLASRGFLRFLSSVSCAWLAILCLLAWRIPQDWLDRTIETLDRTIHG